MCIRFFESDYTSFMSQKFIKSDYPVLYVTIFTLRTEVRGDFNIHGTKDF